MSYASCMFVKENPDRKKGNINTSLVFLKCFIRDMIVSLVHNSNKYSSLKVQTAGFVNKNFS